MSYQNDGHNQMNPYRERMPVPIAEQRKAAIEQLEVRLKSRAISNDIAESLNGALTGEQFIANCLFVATEPGGSKVTDCGVEQMLGAMLRCAQFGLMPGPLQLVDLIPYKGAIDVRVTWRGIKVLMERHPEVKTVIPVLVHRTDDFTVNNGVPAHNYDPFGDRQFRHPSDLGNDLPDLRGGYLRVIYHQGPDLFHFVSMQEIEKRRMCSDTPDLTARNNPGAWRKWYAEMAQKTIVRHGWSRRVVPIDPATKQHYRKVEEMETIRHGEPAYLPVTIDAPALPSPRSGDRLLGSEPVVTGDSSDRSPRSPDAAGQTGPIATGDRGDRSHAPPVDIVGAQAVAAVGSALAAAKAAGDASDPPKQLPLAPGSDEPLSVDRVRHDALSLGWTADDMARLLQRYGYQKLDEVGPEDWPDICRAVYQTGTLPRQTGPGPVNQ